LQPGDLLVRWENGAPRPTKILSIRYTDRMVRVFNLVLDDQEFYIAGGFKVRSKPPLEAATAKAAPELDAVPPARSRQAVP